MAASNPRSPRGPLWPLKAAQTPTPGSPVQVNLTRQLHALAGAASGYLRFHPDRMVQRTIALLAAATLAASAACGPASDAIEPGQVVTVERVAPRANGGFPTTAGSYELRPSSLQMDTGGTYYFWWYASGTGGSINLARGSDVKLVEDERTYLEVDAANAPILHLKADEPVALVAPGEAGVAQAAVPAAAGQQHVSGGFGPALWYPFFLMGGSGFGSIGSASRTPGYYAPSGDVEPGGQVRGGTRGVSAPTSAPPFTLKTTTVSGRAGGTGSGTAATGKTGAASRVGAPSSSGFSSGTGSSSAGSSVS